jgi:hypothetical protein
MVRMVPGVFRRLNLRQSANGQDTEHEENREDFDGSVVHLKTIDTDFGLNGNGQPRRLSSHRQRHNPLLHDIGFIGKMLYTASVLEGGIAAPY